jgi:hypothetical protein
VRNTTILLVCAITAGILLASASVIAGIQTPPPAAPAAVTFLVSIPPDLFAEGTRLDVRVWSAAQIAALENNARCASSRDTRTGAEQVSCPPGVTYQPVTPELVQVALGATRNEIEVPITSVKPGESVRVAVSGLSRDGCNTTSANAVRLARSGRNPLTDLAWQTTARACVKGELR